LIAHPGLAAGLQPPVDHRHLARLVEEFLHRGLFVLGACRCLDRAREALKHGEVGAAGEAVLARGDDRALDVLVRGDLLHNLRQLIHDLMVKTFIERPGMSQVTSAMPSASTSNLKFLRFMITPAR
jgi:hypothetical protein